MSKIDRDLARGAAIRARFRRFGFPDPMCVVCGEDRIWRLDLVRIAGQNQAKSRRPLYGSHHRSRSDDHPRERPRCKSHRKYRAQVASEDMHLAKNDRDQA
jgi:hypothetical protein